MGFEEVKDDIIAKARSESDTIRSDALRKVKEIEKDLKDRLDALKKNHKDTIAAKLNQLEQIRKSDFESAASEIILSKKRQLIDDAVQDAKNQLLGSKTDYYMGRLLEKAKKEIDVEKILCRKEDIHFFNGIKVFATDIDGGIIAENKDGTISIDYSYETILGSIRESNLQKIAEALFK